MALSESVWSSRYLKLFYKKECLLFDHSGEIGLKTVIRSQVSILLHIDIEVC